jgi:hypothetical protein
MGLAAVGLGWGPANCKSLELTRKNFNSFAVPSQHVDVEGQRAAPTQGDLQQSSAKHKSVCNHSGAISNWLPAAMALNRMVEGKILISMGDFSTWRSFEACCLLVRVATQ